MDKMKLRILKFSSLIYLSLLLTLISCESEKKGSHHDAGKENSTLDTGQIYYCPMDTEVVQKGPGICPKCHMDLEVKSHSHSENKMMKDLQDYTLSPVNTAVLSNIKTIRPIHKSVDLIIKSSGYITYDTRRIYNISARIGGRIEKLYMKYSFQSVNKGQPLFDIYSHELLTAQTEYLYLKNSAPDTDLLNAARNKLLLLGMTATQINAIKLNTHVHPTTTFYSPYSGYIIDKTKEETGMIRNSGTMIGSSIKNNEPSDNGNKDILVREGTYVERGENVFKIANTDVVWGIFEIYSDMIPFIKLNQPVHIMLENTDQMIMAKINFIEPSNLGESGTTKFRVYLDNKNQKLKIGNLLSGQIEAGKKTGLWIPANALIDLGKEKIIFIKKDAAFEPKKITTGAASGNEVEVLSGLSEADEIAENAQFLVDSESFINVSRRLE